MIQLIKQARAAFGLLNPEEVRRRAARPVHVGLVASSEQGYSEMEEFLVPTAMPREQRIDLMGYVHRAGDADVPAKVDIVLYEENVQPAKGAYTFHRSDPEATIDEILGDKDELSLALSRLFPPFRKPVIDGIVQSVARENAMFVIATALPNVIPNMLELPWALGEFASDTAFLTGESDPDGVSDRGGLRVGCRHRGAEGRRALDHRERVRLAGAGAGTGGENPAGRRPDSQRRDRLCRDICRWQGDPAFPRRRGPTHKEREAVYREALDHGRNVAQSFDVRP